MKHFIKEIEIKKFKCFDDFKIKNFRRVNLITGKNNVGKTALMEALYINSYSKNIKKLHTAIAKITLRRDVLEYIFKKNELETTNNLFENTKYYYSKSNIRKIEYELLSKDGIKEYKFKIDDNETILWPSNFLNYIEFDETVLYIENFGITNHNLKLVYNKVQRMDKEDELNSYINEFDNSIEKFKIFDNSPECKMKNSDEYRKINEFGDGFKNYIAITSALYCAQNSYFFIDEIENGIHYTQLDKLWEIILKLSKEQNVQVFATTHSKECIEAFNRVSKKLEDNEITLVELFKHNDNIESAVLDIEMLDYQLSQNHEVR